VRASREVDAAEAGVAGGGSPGLLAWQVYFLAWCAGIWSLREPAPALAMAACLWGGLLLFRRPGLVPALCSLGLTAACLAGGAAHARLVLPDVPPPVPTFFAERAKATVRGRVAEAADKAGGRIELLLEGATAELGNATIPVPGLLSLDWDEPDYRPSPGQAATVVVRVRPVHGFRNAGGADFEWRERLRGVFYRAYARGADLQAEWGPRPANFWRDAREGLREAVLSRLPQTPGAGVVLGLLLGERSRIPFEVSDELRAAGLSHTLALSGLNVVYVAALGWALAWLAGLAWPRLYLRLPRAKLAVLLSFPLVAAYVWVGQASASLVRSALMFGFWGLLLLRDRSRALVDGLMWALAVIVLVQPLAVYDLSLQLSAAAVAGLAFTYPWLRDMFPKGGGAAVTCLRWSWDAFSLSLASNLAILPISIWYFGSFAPNFLLNLPWLPVQGVVVQILGMVGMALAPLPGLGAVAGWLLVAASLAQDWMLAALHAGMRAGLFPTWALLRPLWPELLGAALVLALTPRAYGGSRRALLLVLAGLLVMAAPHARLAADMQRQEVRLTLMDVGQAQAALLDLPHGRRVLVDGGGTFSRTFDIGRSVVGPAIAWGRPPRLDAVLMSHPDADHAQGLAWILRHFDVARLCTNGRWPEGRLGEALDAAIAAGAPRPRALCAGDVLELGGQEQDGARLEVLHPAQGYEARGTNDASLVLRLVWRGRPLLVLPGDVQRGGIEDMVDRGREMRADVLVLPHHGSKSSLSGMLYEAVAPRQALASCGFMNPFHFPNKDVAAELERRGIPLASTSDAGMIRAVWTLDGGPRLEFPGSAGR
jgi:competence protein ComEC